MSPGLKQLLDEAFWNDVVPDAPRHDEATPQVDWSTVPARLAASGYFTIPSLFPRTTVEALGRAVTALGRLGLHEAWIFAHPAPWQLLGSAALREGLRVVFGADYLQLPDAWAMHVDRERPAGFAPHPDAEGFPAVEADGSPNAVTIWVALSDATSANGCLHLLPADLREEKHYPFRDEHGSVDLGRVLQRVEALPLPAGGIAGWNHGIIHWGGTYKPWAGGPRISLSTEFVRQNAATESHPHLQQVAPHVPALNAFRHDGSVPAFRERLRLTATQILRYYGQVPTKPQSFDLAQDVLLALSAGSPKDSFPR